MLADLLAFGDADDIIFSLFNIICINSASVMFRKFTEMLCNCNVTGQGLEAFDIDGEDNMVVSGSD